MVWYHPTNMQENVELPMIADGKLTEEQIKKRATELLHRMFTWWNFLGLPSSCWTQRSHEPFTLRALRRWATARVSHNTLSHTNLGSTIARALSNQPEVLLLDEPTGDLDTKNTIEIMDLLLDINLKQKTTCVMVSHNPDIECYADRILYLEDGTFVRQALNYKQTPLIYDQYIQYVNSQVHHWWL